MLYRCDWVETKNKDWKVATLVSVDGVQTENVSINRNDKKTGTVAFPRFDEFAPGAQIEGNLWTSPEGKAYLFAPKPKAPAGAPRLANNMAGVKAAQERKGEMIEKAQDRKNDAITLSSAMRDATLVLTSHYEGGGVVPPDELKAIWRGWRDFFLNEHRIKSSEPFL